MKARDLATKVVMLCGLAWAAAALAADPGPAVGDRFPDELAAPDQYGEIQAIDRLMGEHGLAVFFVRSADWCPFCKAQLADVNTRVPEFAALGINVVSVSVDEVREIRMFSDAQHIAYTMLSDPAGDINERLGIRDEQYPVGSAQFGVPRPTLYVIDRERTIRLRYMEPTYRTRPDLDVVLADVARVAF